MSFVEEFRKKNKEEQVFEDKPRNKMVDYCRKKPFRAIFIILFSGILIIFGYGLVLYKDLKSPREPKYGIVITDPSLSADGKLLLFAMSFQGRVHRLGQLNLETNDLNMFFDLDNNRSWRSPHFSPDGNTIAARAVCHKSLDCPEDERGAHIVLIDPQTHKTKLVTRGSYIYNSISYSLDGKSLTFAYVPMSGDFKRAGFTTVAKINLETGVEEILFPKSEVQVHFKILSESYEVAEGEYVFSARGIKKGKKLKKYLDELKPDLMSGQKSGYKIAYRFKVGKGIEPLPENSNYQINQITVSQGGTRQVFIDRSRTVPVSEAGNWNWELFLMENDEIKQLTDDQSKIHAPYISRDGSRVAYLSDPTRKEGWDVWVVDLPGGTSRSTGLRELIWQDVQRDKLETLAKQNKEYFSNKR